MTARLFPLGQYLGPFFPARNASMTSHRVRVGRSVIHLASGEELAVWGLAHGLSGGERTDAPWTRAAMVDAAREQSGTDISGVLADLLAAGVLVEVAADTDREIAFVRGHRFRGLLHGLGSSADRPDLCAVGLMGHPLATVDLLAFEMWQWAPLHPSLHASCEAFAATEGATPEAVVSRVLDRAHVLLAHSAGYLDVVEPSEQVVSHRSVAS